MGNDVGYPELSEHVALFVYQQRNPGVVDIPQTCSQILEKGYSYDSQLQPSMLQVIFVELEVCTLSAFMHVPHGEMGPLIMTLSLLKKILL